MKKILILFAVSVAASFAPQFSLYSQSAPDVETIVIIRHGEKTQTELGQLNVMGLNRALALPDVLTGKFGKPDFIFAPDPSEQVGRKGRKVSYVRPLATIEPTAVKLGMSVNAQFGYTQIVKLQSELLKPEYSRAVVFIAWEHAEADRLAKNIVESCGGKRETVPDWPGKDFDSIFVIRISRSEGRMTAAFSVEKENLDGKLSNTFPSPGK
jgi:hypothetical protein